MNGDIDKEHVPGCIIWVDLTDLVEFFNHNRTVTGIQRVVSMIVMAIDDAPPGPSGRLEIRLCEYDFAADTYHELDRNSVQQALRAILSGQSDPGPIFGEGRSAATFRDGDIFLVMGAFWFRSYYRSAIFSACAQFRMRLAVVCHDLIPVWNHRWFSPGYVAEISAIWDDVFNHAELVLSISQYSAEGIADYCRSRQLTNHAPLVVRLGDSFLDFRPRAPAAGDDRVSRYTRPGFVLNVGSLGTRKNQALLFPVWDRLFEAYGPATPYLVFIGKPVPPFNPQDYAIRSDAGRQRIVFLEDVTDAELAAFYRASAFTIFPSLAEGWGLPVAESLAQGKLCLASNAAAIPEVGGPLAEYFDPTSVEQCYRKVAMFFFEPDIRARAEQRIRASYRKTSWADCARQLRVTIEHGLAVPKG